MAGIKAPLKDLLTKLATITVVNQDGNAVPLYTRVWNNQINLENQAKLYDYPKPAAFVEIVSPVAYNEIGVNFLQTDLTFHIHLIHEYYNQDGTFEQDLTIYDLRDAVIRLLSNFTPTACSNLTCDGETMSYDHDNLYHYILSFDCAFIDSNGSPWNPGSGIYIDSVPPTTLQTDVIIAAAPLSDVIVQPLRILK